MKSVQFENERVVKVGTYMITDVSKPVFVLLCFVMCLATIHQALL